ncbi:hypothetical protein BOTBODRAFT_34211 [Botryobasidium botryosum FD-172 SS1]|uniref:Uncharacterized protein n=1 Tax=Botryobasidium botryosum (strain FD-172 SS1) TaxID=930990 RepID=A0A067MME4_BOTB1|nr:hypothetical protein BOTBODRAFT_34211 [Botryobasidium botryosum FD-172 SS1]
MLELDLRPGYGLGAFELGASLWNVLDTLREDPTHPQVDVKFDALSPSTSPIILHVRPHVDLLFTGHAQRLHTISLRRLRGGGPGANELRLTYRDQPISAPAGGVVLRRGSVHKVFGPTYAGDAMRYPGVWFAFEEDGAPGGGMGGGVGGGGTMPMLVKKGEAADAERERAQEVKRVVICQRSAGAGEEGAVGGGGERDGFEEVIECPVMMGDLKRAVVKVKSGVTLYFYSPASSPSDPIHVQIGRTSAEDLLCDLGPPLRIHYKEDDRMTIHATPSTTTDPDETNEGYFYNYFQHGIDFLLSGTTHKVKKIVLHSNVPGSHLFQRYKRCPWEIVPTEGDEDDSLNNVSFHDKIEDITSVLNPSSRETPPSMILDRSADFPETLTLPGSTTRLTGFDGVVLEVSEIGDVLSVMLF